MSKDSEISLVVTEAMRIDKYLALQLTISRTDIQKLIANQAIKANEIIIRKASFVLQVGMVVTVTLPLSKSPSDLEAQNIPLEIVYEDTDIIVINKPSGMVVHPSPGHRDETLVNALLYHFKDQLSNWTGPLRPGIVHRIDKDTSGLLVVAKNDVAHQFLASQLKDHSMRRTYLAWVEGQLANEVTHINLPIGRDLQSRQKMAIQAIHSKHAITHVYVLKVLQDKTLVRCELETGRTHQIRVHLAYIHHPVLGDPVYGRKIDNFNQRLHAYQLELVHPTTHEKMTFTVDPPLEFNDFKATF